MRTIIFVFMICSMLPLQSLSAGQKIEIITENGVTIIQNPKIPVPPQGGPRTVVLKENLVLGKNQSREDYGFNGPRNIAIDGDGNIYVTDVKDLKIRVFDSHGIYLRAFGRSGQGPGEFQTLSSIDILSDGTIRICDLGARRICFLTFDGKYLKDLLLKNNLADIKIDSRGSIYGQLMQISGNKFTQQLIKVDPNQNPLMKIHSVEWIFKRESIEAFPERFLYELNGKGELVWGVASAYDLRVLGLAGKMVRRILKDHDFVKITAAQKNDLAKQDSKLPSPPGGGPITRVYPDHYPAIYDLKIDDTDRIFIATYEKAEPGNRRIDVFDPEGRYIARFGFPENEWIQAIKKDEIYSTCVDEPSGIPLVKRYLMVWK